MDEKKLDRERMEIVGENRSWERTRSQSWIVEVWGVGIGMNKKEIPGDEELGKGGAVGKLNQRSLSSSKLRRNWDEGGELRGDRREEELEDGRRKE